MQKGLKVMEKVLEFQKYLKKVQTLKKQCRVKFVVWGNSLTQSRQQALNQLPCNLLIKSLIECQTWWAPHHLASMCFLCVNTCVFMITSVNHCFTFRECPEFWGIIWRHHIQFGKYWTGLLFWSLGLWWMVSWHVSQTYFVRHRCLFVATLF